MFDTVITGSGPAGLGAALYLERAGKNILVIEKEYEGVGQIEKSICVENYLGIPSVTGHELGEKFRNHVMEMGASFLEDEVTEILRERENAWKLVLASGGIIETKTLIYAAGTVPRKLGVPSEEKFEGRGISYCAYCDGALYRNREVAVIGGGDTAIDDALYLSGICRKVYLIHRRSEFRSSIEKIKAKENVEIITQARVQEINGHQVIEEIKLDNGREIKIDGLFVAIGSDPETELIKEYVKRDSAGYVLAGEDGITQTPGLFAAGDIRAKKLRQVITAVADGANAAASAVDFLNKHH